MEGRLRNIFIAVGLPVIAFISIYLFKKKRKEISPKNLSKQNSDKINLIEKNSLNLNDNLQIEKEELSKMVCINNSMVENKLSNKNFESNSSILKDDSNTMIQNLIEESIVNKECINNKTSFDGNIKDSLSNVTLSEYMDYLNYSKENEIVNNNFNKKIITLNNHQNISKECIEEKILLKINDLNSTCISSNDNIYNKQIENLTEEFNSKDQNNYDENIENDDIFLNKKNDIVDSSEIKITANGNIEENEKKEKIMLNNKINDNQCCEYNFELPQILCGFLIGKQRRMINTIMSNSNTKIDLIPHPFCFQFKICSIKGTEKNIKIALNFIRKRFPLIKFPSLTLADIDFSEFRKIEAIPYIPKLNLPESVNCDVILSNLVDAGHIFLQQPTHPTFHLLKNLEEYMKSIYEKINAPDINNLSIGFICVAYNDNKWYRVFITQVIDDETCLIKFLDYGGFMEISKKNLKQINRNLMTLPFQACECILANVRPIDDKWSEEANNYLKELTENQIFQCLVVDYLENGLPLVHLLKVVNTKLVLINLELVKSGNANWVE